MSLTNISDVVTGAGTYNYDAVLPTVGNSGTLAAPGAVATEGTVTWTKATDTGSTAANLKYFAFHTANGVAFADNVIATIEAGTAINAGGTLDIATATKAGLTSANTHDFCVIVMDEAGNKAAYTKTGLVAIP